MLTSFDALLSRFSPRRAPAPRPIDTLRILVQDGQPLCKEAALYFLIDNPEKVRSGAAALLPASSQVRRKKRKKRSKQKFRLFRVKNSLIRSDQEKVLVKDRQILVSVTEALILKRLLAARPWAFLTSTALFADIPESSWWNFLRSLRKKLANDLPWVTIENVLGHGYRLVFLEKKKWKQKDPAREEKRLRRLRNALEKIELSHPFLKVMLSCLLEANGKGVSASQFPGGYRASNTIVKRFRQLQSEVASADPGFHACFIALTGVGYILDLSRYGRT